MLVILIKTYHFIQVQRSVYICLLYKERNSVCFSVLYSIRVHVGLGLEQRTIIVRDYDLVEIKRKH